MSCESDFLTKNINKFCELTHISNIHNNKKDFHLRKPLRRNSNFNSLQIRSIVVCGFLLAEEKCGSHVGWVEIITMLRGVLFVFPVVASLVVLHKILLGSNTSTTNCIWFCQQGYIRHSWPHFKLNVLTSLYYSFS